MPTLRQYRREMYARSPGNLGRVETIASLTTTTAVVTALAAGGISPQKFVNKWLVRSEAASAADYVRRCTDFATATGTFTHAGTNYSDTTATSEFLEVVDYEPKWLNMAIDTTLRKLRQSVRTALPTVHGASRLWLTDMDWIRAQSDIDKVTYRNDPVLNRNRYLDSWHTVNTSGALQLDHYTLAGASGTLARSTTQKRLGNYSAALTRSGTNVTLTQTIGILPGAIDGETLAGKTVTLEGWMWASVASRGKFTIYDGSTTTATDYHTGGSGWERLTKSVTLGASATTLQIAATVETGDTTVYFDELYIHEGSAGRDDVRQDYRPEHEVSFRYSQGSGTHFLELPQTGRMGQYVVYSTRAYPGYDATRLAANTAEADEMDAPLTMTAVGALGTLYKGLAEQETDEREAIRLVGKAAYWSREFEKMAGGLLTRDPEDGGNSVPLPMRTLAPAARRY